MDALIGLFKENGIEFNVSVSSAHWSHGLIERHNSTLRSTYNRTENPKFCPRAHQKRPQR